MFVRLIAGCVMLVGLLDVGLYLTKCLLPRPPLPVKVLPILSNSIPLVIGVVIFIKARAVADWLAEKLE